MRPSGAGRTRLRFYIPTRGLIGYQPELLSDTRGTAVMNRIFHAYEPFRGEIPGRRNGVLLSNAQGEAVAYALFNLQDRGPMMIDPGMRVYQGMIVGEHSRGNDLEVNVLKGKQLTNIRAAGKDENTILTPPMKLCLERALSYIEEDELVEVTPEIDPPAQDPPRPPRPQARRARQSQRGLTASPLPLGGGWPSASREG